MKFERLTRTQNDGIAPAKYIQFLEAFQRIRNINLRLIRAEWIFTAQTVPALIRSAVLSERSGLGFT
jgi:hypothetical protein